MKTSVLRSELGHRYQVIGESVPMKALRQQIAVTAPTNGRVLIYGESGTGKELVARSLHAASLRSKGPFVEVSCAAIPEELIESELFGHIKGSFTGASEDKIGKFQKADGGTLFLDEVGDMSLRTQSKVLRVLEEQRFERVGSNQTLSVDVRVFAATNKNLEQEISRGAFRQDLFYRLNVIPFFVTPLRDRKGDIPVLARYLPERIQRGVRQENPRTERLRYGDPAALSVARKCSRIAESGGTPGDCLPASPHRAAPSAAGAIPRRGRESTAALFDVARSSQRLRARIHPPQTAGASLEHDANRLRSRVWSDLISTAR